MVGTYADAALALSDFVTGDYSRILSREGSARIVYLINGVVYKIDRAGSDDNIREYEAIRSANALPDNVFYPETSLYCVGNDDVIAMEYIRGQAIYMCIDSDTGDICDPMCMTNAERNLFTSDILPDPSGMNVIRTDNGYYIIDAA